MPTSTGGRDPPRSQSELSEGAGLGFPQQDPIIGPVEVGQHEDVEQLGAGSGAEGVETLAESAFKIIGVHASSNASSNERTNILPDGRAR